MPSKSLLGRQTRPDDINNRQQALHIRESNFLAVHRSDSTSQNPIATSQPNSSADTHTHRRKQPPKERLGRGEEFLQRRQQKHLRHTRFGVLRINAARKVQLPEGPALRIHHQPQDEELLARREQNCGIEGARQQRLGIR